MQQNKEAAVAFGTRSLVSESDDESFSPTMLFHSSDSDSDSVSLVDSGKEAEVEEGIRMEDVDADHFDPFEGPAWDDQCDDFDNYLTKLYKNGELYTDKGFGNIVIKE